MEPEESLLQKYGIPIGNLDFGYIEKCTDGREMEKIVNILRSGQEGYFPDLTKCAEKRLEELKPKSKALRKEQSAVTKHSVDSEKWKELTDPIITWSNEVKIKDKFLSTISEPTEEKTDNIPPVRHETKTIDLSGKKNKPPEQSSTESTAKKENAIRIKSTDYNKWDKYDAETEILKMELEEERSREEVERMNKINAEKTKKYTKSETDIINEGLNQVTAKLTNVEKEALATKYKEQGNDFFRAAEYENAITDYTKCIHILPSGAGYNNRAIAYLKLNQFTKCIDDCDRCLQLEPKNIKALLRKGQAFVELAKLHEACEVYANIISIDPSNIVARNCLNELKNRLPDKPPASATRITIEDVSTTDSDKTECKKTTTPTLKKPVENIIPKQTATVTEINATDVHKAKIQQTVAAASRRTVKPEVAEHEEDLSKLIVPKKIVQNKFASTLATMGSGNPKKASKSKSDKRKLEKPPKPEIELVTNSTKKPGTAILIEEI